VEADVAIVGAGPAGSTLAALLAARGVDVVLADRDAFPRDKLCGEFLSYDALPIAERLGVLAEIDTRNAPRIEHCRLVGRSRTYEFSLPHPARGVSRLLLDELLLRAAQRAGARVLEGWTATALPLRLERSGESIEVRAKVIVGAWGRWGRFDTVLGRQFVRDHKHRNFGFKRHYSGPAPENVIELYSFDRGYLGVNAIEGGLTNICGLVHESRLAGHRGKWDAFVDAIRGEEPQLERLYAAHPPAQDGFLSSEPVIFRPRDPVEQQIFLIGDASGLIDPLTGNGMAMAMQSALLAAPYVKGSLEGQDVAFDYVLDHRDLFDRRIAWSRITASMLSRPRLLDALMATVRSPFAGGLLVRKTRAPLDAVNRLLDAWFC
jgi:flavin-dependent dehydrogenase